MRTERPSEDILIAEMRAEFPNLRIIDKREDRLSKLIDLGLRILTFGGQRGYIDHYTTTLGSRIYLPASWKRYHEIDRIVIMRHERVHLRQFRRFGIVGMSLLYALPFFPLGLAYGRMILEREAYKETIFATAELLGQKAVLESDFQERIVRQFTSPAYAWMWPFPRSIRRWVKTTVVEATS